MPRSALYAFCAALLFAGFLMVVTGICRKDPPGPGD